MQTVRPIQQRRTTHHRAGNPVATYNEDDLRYPTRILACDDGRRAKLLFWCRFRHLRHVDFPITGFCALRTTISSVLYVPALSTRSCMLPKDTAGLSTEKTRLTNWVSSDSRGGEWVRGTGCGGRFPIRVPVFATNLYRLPCTHTIPQDMKFRTKNDFSIYNCRASE